MSESDREKYYPAKEFHSRMVNYLDEYSDHLLMSSSDGSAISHTSILHEFINFLFNRYLIEDIPEITPELVTKHFLPKYRRMNKGQKLSAKEFKLILSGFFTFLYGKYGIENRMHGNK